MKPHPPVAAALAAALAASLLMSLAAAAQEEPSGLWVEGFTEAWRDATLSSPVGGIVGTIQAREGERVKEGRVIVEFRGEIEELEAERRLVRMEAARGDFERTRELFERTSAVSREELDRHEAEYRIANSELQLAMEMLERTRLTAPFDGEVIDLYSLEVGEARREREPIVRLVDASRCRLVVHLNASAAHLPDASSAARVRLADGSEVPGEIEFVSPVADPASGLFPAKVLFDNPGNFRPGMAASLWVPHATATASESSAQQ